MDFTRRLGFPEAQESVRQQPFDVPEYLRLTPVNMKEEDKYPYTRPELWEHIQYLPSPIANVKFYKPWNNGSYERSLTENYLRLEKIKRTTDIAKLKRVIK
jgi:putative ATPase